LKRPEDLTSIAPPPYFPDGVVAYRIANGGEVMPAWKGVLRGDDIWDLINFIRSLSR
jgi:mono/diheme cytochrome c family protein